MTEKKERPPPPTIEEQDKHGTAPWVQTLSLNPSKESITFADLFAELTDYFRRYLVLTDERQYAVLAAWTLHTWRINDYRATGPLWIMGPINSGKTTVLDALEYVAFKGVRGGSMSNAVMFRMSEDYTPCYLLDESKLLINPEFAETQAFLNERYKKNGKVWRIEEIDGRRIYKSFKAYGATAFAGDSPPWEAMASRALVIQMEKGQPRDQTLTRIHEQIGLELRQKLLTFADRWVNRENIRDDTDLYPDTIERYISKLSDYRVREVGYPLLEMSPDTGPREAISSYLEDLQRTHEAEETTGYLSDYVLALKNSPVDGDKIEAGDIRKQLAIVRGVDENKPGKGFPGPKGIMKAMRTLGFKPTRTGHNMAGIWADNALFARLLKRYKLEGQGPLPMSSVSSVSSGPLTLNPEQPEQPEQIQKGGLYEQKRDSLGSPLSCEYCGEEWPDNSGYRKHVCPVGPKSDMLSRWTE